jgi:hypothetical protein
LLFFTGLYLFVLPYATKWRSGDAPTEQAVGRTLRRGLSSVPAFWLNLGKRKDHHDFYSTLWNNKSRWNTQRIPEECLVATQRHSERHSCSLFSG